MAGSHNLIIIVGNLGRDPELRHLPSGDPVTDFSVATTERRRTPDGQHHEQTTWFKVSTFGRLAETCSQFLHKGSYIYVEGSLSQREWIGNDGTNRTTLEVRAREMRMLDRRGDGGEGSADRSSAGEPATPGATGDEADLDEVPF